MGTIRAAASPVEKNGARLSLLIVYLVLFALGGLTWAVLGVHPLLVPISYLITTITAFVTHVLGHYQIFARWFKAHTIEHHIDAYPPSRLLSDQYIGAEDANDKFYIPSMFGPSFVAFLLGFSWATVLVMAVTGGGALWVTDYLHTGMHLKNFWMDRFALYRELRRLHMFHHKGNFRINYGVYDFSYDMIFNTMRYS